MTSRISHRPCQGPYNDIEEDNDGHDYDNYSVHSRDDLYDNDHCDSMIRKRLIPAGHQQWRRHIRNAGGRDGSRAGL